LTAAVSREANLKIECINEALPFWIPTFIGMKYDDSHTLPLRGVIATKQSEIPKVNEKIGFKKLTLPCGPLFKNQQYSGLE
jgi:hypothetical protein